jgi:hypothetical protein
MLSAVRTAPAATLQVSRRLRVPSGLRSAGAWWEELRQLLELLA